MSLKLFIQLSNSDTLIIHEHFLIVPGNQTTEVIEVLLYKMKGKHTTESSYLVVGYSQTYPQKGKFYP